MTLTFAIGKENVQKIKLSDNSTGVFAPADLSTVTRVVMELGEVVIDSDIITDAFDLSANNGTITIKILNVPDLQEGTYDASVTIYKPTAPAGIQWMPSFKVKLV